MLNSWLVVIPARLKSTRLPEKPLVDLGGKPMIIRVAQNLTPLAKLGATIVVATDSIRIKEVCEAEGIAAMLTAESHLSGTDRCHEVSQQYHKTFIMNLQGDEPFINIQTLTDLMSEFEKSSCGIGTLVFQRKGDEHFSNPSIVKAVFNRDKKAIYFSRSPIPFSRDQHIETWWQHQGVYVFRQETLNKFVNLGVSNLESIEKLEQLRAIEHGIEILMVESKFETIGIDTPEDLAKARGFLDTHRGILP